MQGGEIVCNMPFQTPSTGAGSGDGDCKPTILAALNTLETRVFEGNSSFIAVSLSIPAESKWGSLSVGHYELCRDDIGDLPGSPNHL